MVADRLSRASVVIASLLASSALWKQVPESLTPLPPAVASGAAPADALAAPPLPPAAASATPPAVDEGAQTPGGAAAELATAFRQAAQRILPSVVTIEGRSDHGESVAGDAARSQKPWGLFPESRDKSTWNNFFPRLPAKPPREKGRPAGTGSGVVIATQGLILTNHHVIQGHTSLTVRLADGREFPVIEAWSDPPTDVAVVRIAGATDLVAAPLGDSDQLGVGDWVLALGQPFGLENTVTAGIVSALRRSPGITARESFIQTDAAMNPGSSGGPLVNLQGQVVGISTAISTRSGGHEGVGFAVPINLARSVAEQLVREGRVPRSSHGLSVPPQDWREPSER